MIIGQIFLQKTLQTSLGSRPKIFVPAKLYTVVSRIYAFLRVIAPPPQHTHTHYQQTFLHRYFYLAYRPPNHGHSTKMMFLHCQVQGPCGNARTKPASIEQLRNSPSITSVFASGVNQQHHIERANPLNAWKMPLSTLWPTSVSRSCPSSFWGSGDDRISSEGRSAASIGL